ncbi:MAG TPA: HEAT repeat domain-containing protein [Gemmataceae bacterium]|jgi:HEAT repeat protein
MPSFKSLFAALCLLCLALPLLAEKPDGGRLINKNDSRQQYPSQETKIPIPRDIGGKTYKDWKKDLTHPDPSVRATAISVIPGFREDAMDCVPLLIDRTRDKDASPRVKAVLALKFMGINGADRERVVKALGERIATDTQAIVRYEAAQALTRFGADGQAVVGDLVKGLGDTSTWELRHACIVALIVAGVDEKKGPDSRVTEALIPRTKPFYEPSRQVRLEAIMALGAMGRPQAPAKLDMVVRALKEHQNSSDKGIKIWTHVSLMALEDKVKENDLKMIVKYLDEPDREVRVQAVTALGAMQKKAAEHVKDICALLRHEKEPMVQSAACQSLARMGDKSDRVLQALIRLTELDSRESISVSIAACQALAQLHVANKDVMAALNKVLEHHSLDSQQKDVVRQTIEQIQKPLVDDDNPKKKPKVENGVNAPKK